MIGGSVVGALLAAQLIPYGRDHATPPVIAEPRWDTPAIRALAQRACFDCHSNETRWPWYSNVAPISWLLQHDVDDGRRSVNFSEWGRTFPDAAEAGDTIRDREMPPRTYLFLHPEANLSTAQRQQLASGLDEMFARPRSSRAE